MSENGTERTLTLEEIEESIPEERKNLSFGGGADEGIIDVMEQTEKDAHHRGQHMDEEHPTCPFCPDPENEHVSVQITGLNEQSTVTDNDRSGGDEQ